METDARTIWHPPAIEGRSVVLRRHQPANLPSVMRWYRDPELIRLTRYQSHRPSDDEIVRIFHDQLMARSSLAYAIHLRETDRLIGHTTFSAFDGENGSALFHITIGEPDALGHGLGTETCGLMLRHAFLQLGLHRVGLNVFAFNERAIRAYLRAGFRIEGRLREAIHRDGRFWDEIQMGALRDEWLAGHRVDDHRADNDGRVADRPPQRRLSFVEAPTADDRPRTA